MIDLYCGVPGSGKSCTALFDGIMHLLEGGVLATNFRFVPDWAERLASRSLRCRLGLADPVKYAFELKKRCFLVGTQESIWELSKHASLATDKKADLREGKILVILDECQFYFNSRNWEKNKGFIEIFTQHRKMRLDFILIAHHVEMIDKQIRFLIEYETFFRNFTRIKMPIPFLSIRLCPFPAFLAIRQYSNMGGSIAMKEKTWVQPLNKRIADLYDTLEIFNFSKDPPKLQYQTEPFTRKRYEIPDRPFVRTCYV